MRKSVVVAVALLVLASTANAQYFGRNKVQWRQFNFKILRTEHFDIYYYDREADVVNDVGRMAERWYARLSRVFNHSFSHKPIVVYANAADFQQTTTTPELIGQGTGGFTDPFMNRVVLPLTGDPAENDHVLGHELVHVFQFDIGASLTNNRRRFNLEQMPLWLVEGMAEYFSKGRIDPLTAMWIRDAVIHNRMPDLRKLTNDPYYFPYRYGQALLAYIGGRFGDDAVVRLFLAAGSVGPQAAFERALGIPAKQIFADWAESARDLYNPVVEERPFTLGQPLIGASKAGIRGYLNVGPAYSPDGRYLAFLSTRDIFDIDLFLADAHTGKVIRQLASAERNAHFEALRFIDSAGAWSPDSTQLAFVVFEKGKNYIGIVDVNNRHEHELRIPGVDAINNIAWSPDGHTLAIAGQATGASDLFLYDMNTNQVRRLTNDGWADMQPAFSPDGHKLVWVSDRGANADLGELYFPAMNIWEMDLDSGAMHMLPLFPHAKNFDPHYDADGSSVYFISSAEGVPDVYRYVFSDNRVQRVTHVQTGVSGITEMSPALTVAERTGAIAFSMFEDDDYNIYRLSPPPAGVAVTTTLPEEAARAAQLPPLRGTGSAITAYMEQPAAGLLPAGTTFETEPVSRALHLAYLGPPTIGVGVGSFGTGVAGSVAAYFSDVLGTNNVGFSFEGGGSYGIGTFADQFVGEVFYLNQSHRWNWGIDYTHLPYVSAATGAGVDTQGNTVIQQERDIFRYDDVSGVVQYPFSTTRRVEFSAGFQRQSLKADLETAVIDAGGNIISDQTVPLINPIALNLFRTSAAFVGDSSIWGFLSPVQGTRYRYEVDEITGNLHFTTALADYRRYFFAKPVTFAIRGIHYGRYGSGADDPRIQPIYLGDPSLVHGYEFGSIGLNECVQTGNPGACPVFDRLLGSRIAVANAEIRVPLFGTKEFGLFSGFLPTELFLFTDAGVAWTGSQSPVLKFETNTTDRVPVVSSGAGLRLLLSYIPLEFYWAHPYQRPGKGLVFGFNIIPGW